MYIEKFLTEYDDSLTGELNVDPLGQLVIWSSWGQDIFHSRITSIANDVRQYTLIAIVFKNSLILSVFLANAGLPLESPA